MGPLAGLRIVELAGVGPAPMCCMMLADLGATVLRVDRATPVELGIKRPLHLQLVLRNRRSIAVDLKQEAARSLVLELVETADAIVEGFRPGVAERLGLGPDQCLGRNPKLVYGRVTGWGQDGPLAQAAGHDLNYIALTGALHAMGPGDRPPPPPLNLIGDYAGGSHYLAIGLLAAILEARQSGRGQVVDAAIVDGTANLMVNHFSLLAAGAMTERRGENFLDGGAPFYATYVCADGGFVSVAAIESRFFRVLLAKLGLDAESFPPQHDRARWPEARAILARTFLTRPRDEWAALLEGSDACFAPVLSASEAMAHPQMRARGAFIELEGVPQPAPAPRFSRTVPAPPHPPRAPETEAALAGWLPAERIVALLRDGVLAGPA